jgi:hypothetical protein
LPHSYGTVKGHPKSRARHGKRRCVRSQRSMETRRAQAGGGFAVDSRDGPRCLGIMATADALMPMPMSTSTSTSTTPVCYKLSSHSASVVLLLGYIAWCRLGGRSSQQTAPSGTAELPCVEPAEFLLRILLDCEALTAQSPRCQCLLDPCRKAPVARRHWTSVWCCYPHAVAGRLTACSEDGWHDGWMYVACTRAM